MLFEFKNNEQSYLRWLRKHPLGFVMNTRRSPDPAYTVLHKALCHTVRRYPNMETNPGGFTENAYIKISADSIEELRAWVKSIGRSDGSFSKECEICKPYWRQK